MERYYYHGIGDDLYCLWKMIEIIKSGSLKARKTIRNFNDEKYNHVCLYKKNEDYNYDEINDRLKSARSGWIDNCWFFIISPDILAKKVKTSDVTGFDEFGNPTTNLVDEWRSEGDIPLDKIVGIGIPFDYIAQSEKKFGFVEDMNYNVVSFEEYHQLLRTLISLVHNFNWIIVNSEEKDVCDKMDEQLNSHGKKL